jgi:hypothetical protein
LLAYIVALGVFAILVPSDPVRAQASAADGPWSGEMVCVLSTRGTSYQEDQTHTWRLTGAPPTVPGAVRHWPAVWSVKGSGRNATDSWTIDVPETSGPLAIYELPGVRGRNGLRIESQHGQLVARESLRVAPVPGAREKPLSATIWEWQFPKVTADDAAAVTTVSDASTRTQRGTTYAWRVPPDAVTTEMCKWRFDRGASPGTSSSNVSRLFPGLPPQIAGRMAGAGRPTTGAAAIANPSPAPPQPAPAPQPAVVQPNPSVPTLPTPTAPPTSSQTQAQTQTAASQPTVTFAPGTPVNSLPGRSPGGGLTAIPAPANTSTGSAPTTGVDPARFTATQTADGTVQLTWDAVPGAGSYMLGGPGAGTGIIVNGLSHTLSGIPQGPHTWTVATMYNPGGILTTANQWSRASATVVNKSGRYRMVVNGFRVNNETKAGALGEHNAVYAAVAVGVVSRQGLGLLQAPATVRSLVHGDTQREPNRMRAGTASATGGLQAGDTVPGNVSPAMASTVTPTPTTFPMLVWEGQLSDGLEAVVVRPSLWVRNGPLDTYNLWVSQVTNPAAYVGASIDSRITGADLTPFRVDTGAMFMCYSAEQAAFLVGNLRCQSGFDRPIGLLPHPDPFLSHMNAWRDVFVVVTREAVEKALSSLYQTGGVSSGVIAINLVDNGPAWGGNYDLYLRVERVP